MNVRSNSSKDENLPEQLVAYLDGELDPLASRDIEERLARDPAVRGELNTLQQTWQLLDELPRSDVSEKFTQTTIEMVAAKASEDLEVEQRRQPRRQIWRRAALAATVILSAAAGFYVSRSVWPDENRQLVDILPVLIRLDQYRQVDSLELLQQLKAEPSLQEVVAAGPVATNGIEQFTSDLESTSVQQREESLEALEPTERQQLLRNLERFQSYPDAEQRRLKDLAQAVHQSPDSAELLTTMERYYRLLASLPAGEREEFQRLGVDARIAQVRKVQDERRLADQGRILNEQDLGQVRRWLFGLVKRHETSIVAGLSTAERAAVPNNPRFRPWHLMRHASGRPELAKLLTAEDISELEKDLSPEPLQRLQNAGGLPQQQELLRAWTFVAARAPWGDPRGSSRDRLRDALKKLPEEDREQFINLPDHEVWVKLREYWQQKRPNEPLPESMRGGPRDDRRGPRRDDGRGRPRSEREHERSSSPQPEGRQ